MTYNETMANYVERSIIISGNHGVDTSKCSNKRGCLTEPTVILNNIVIKRLKWVYLKTKVACFCCKQKFCYKEGP